MRRLAVFSVVAAVLLLPAAAGPLGLPVPKPSSVIGNTVDKVRDTAGDTVNTAKGTLADALSTAGLDAAGRPVDPTLFDKDPNGDRVVRGVLVAVALTDSARDAADALGLEVIRTETLDPLDIEVTHLELPAGVRMEQALAALRAADPDGTFDYEHVYDPAGTTAPGATAPALPRLDRSDIEVGMIDAGLARDHPALADVDIVVKTTTVARGPSRATEHGTAVASLLVGKDRAFHGALPGATLYAADAFAGAPTGGSAADIARAIAWLVDKDVPVINISIAGPKNALLEAAVHSAIARGHVIVAPVGNDGPAAPVRYPAAFDGVIAVTSIDARRRVQLDANRGPAVAFAAFGVDVRAASLQGGYAAVTGTSFASPLVTARFAELLPKPDAAHAAAARAQLVGEAGSRARRDPILGYGVLVAPAQAASLDASKP